MAVQIVGGGEIINQIQSTKYTTAQTFSSISVGSWQTTGLTLSITPTSASNRILVMMSAVGAPNYTTSNGGMQFRIDRDGTDITGVTANNVSSASNGERLTPNVGYMYLDSPATTSAVTYTLQVTAHTGTVTLYLNRNYNQSSGFSSTLTLMEVSG